MDHDLLVSIVIPIYNVEKYLERCIGSVRSQTYRRLEIILVDDGSPDRSPELCDAYAREDSRIKVVHRQNGGLSAARNSGVSDAGGNFVFFLDADDQILPDTIETLVHMCETGPAQIAVVGFANVIDGKPLATPRQTASDPLILTSAEALIAMLYQNMFDTSAWAKLIPLDLAKRFPFPVGRVYEDLATVYQWLLSADAIAYSAEAKYLYTHNDDGIISQSASLKNATDEKSAMDALYQAVSEALPAGLPAARSRRFSTYCHILLTMESKTLPQAAFKKDIRRTLAQDCLPVLFDRKARPKNRLGAAVYFVSREAGLRLISRLIRRVVPSADRSLTLLK